MNKFTIHPSEEFLHLSKAPIVEAVLDIRANLHKAWNQNEVIDKLKSDLPEYSDIKPQRQYQTFVQTRDNDIPEVRNEDLGMVGVMARTSNEIQITQFQRGGFVFSKLTPYESWNKFLAEALRLWHIYQNLAGVANILRIGVRYINRIEVPANNLEVSDYIRLPVNTIGEMGLIYTGFLYQESLRLPDDPYLIRTIDLQNNGNTSNIGLILDIDVFTTESTESTDQLLTRLSFMHHVKNKVFFSSITDKTKELLK
jgi:uncharacterized protein (TIGR04255 family)